MELPYTYTDAATLTIDNTTGTWQISVWDDSEGASINAPTGPDAVALARAVLAAAGDTGHVVVEEAQVARQFKAEAAIAARSMRERAARVAEINRTGRTEIAMAIRALPLVSDAPRPAAAPLTADNDA